jgi:transposase-like protein
MTCPACFSKRYAVVATYNERQKRVVCEHCGKKYVVSQQVTHAKDSSSRTREGNDTQNSLLGDIL